MLIMRGTVLRRKCIYDDDNNKMGKINMMVAVMRISWEYNNKCVYIYNNLKFYLFATYLNFTTALLKIYIIYININISREVTGLRNAIHYTSI